MHTILPRWFRLILSLVMVMAAALLFISSVQASDQSLRIEPGEGSRLDNSLTSGAANESIYGGVNSSNRLAIDWPMLGNWAWARLREVITFLIFGLLAIWLFPKQLNRSVERLRISPGKSTVFGLLVVIVGYIAIILLLLVVVGLFIFFLFIQFQGLGWSVFYVGLSVWGLSLAAFTLIVSYASKLVVAFAIGKLLLDYLLPKAKKRSIWPLLVGVLLYVLIRSIPWLGWAFGVVATLMGLGAIWLAFQARRFAIVDQSAGDEPPEQAEAISPVDVEVETGEPVGQPVELAEPAEAVELVEPAEAAESGELAEAVEPATDAVEAATTEVGDREASLELDQAPVQNEDLQPPASAKD